MRLTVVDHPVVAHKLSALRDAETASPDFRRLLDELVTLLAYEATRELPVREHLVRTPLAETTGVHLAGPAPLLVPVLRAGAGMLDGMIRLLPDAVVGFAGLARDEATQQASWYADRLPADAGGRPIFILDPMLATGGTLAAVIRALTARRAGRITAVSLLAAPEGLAALAAEFGSLHVVTAAVDERLDERGFIRPGLGDAGDRLFGPAGR